MSASRGELQAIAFCFEDTATQIHASVAAAHARGLRAPTEEERERQRFDLALSLLRAPSERGRRLGAAYLMELEGAA